MGARDDIAGPIEVFLLQLADDKNCTTEDLSVALFRAAEQLALECYRRGADRAFEDAPTGTWRRPQAALEPRQASASGVLPAGLWEGETPQTPVSVDDVQRSRRK